MGIKINTIVTGSFTRAGKGTGIRGGNKVLEDTGRTLVLAATEMGQRIISSATLEEMAKIMVEEVQRETPVKTSALQQSIRTDIGQSKKGKAQIKVKAGGPDFPVTPNSSKSGVPYVDYAVQVHEENPYMFRGMANARQRVEDAIVKGAKRATKGKK
jgi:hypothetical protein